MYAQNSNEEITPAAKWNDEQASEEKFSILLVDDRPDKLIALEAALEELGQNIVKASSGAEALRLLLRQDFAVILLDVSMPLMDGFETASLIRQRARSEHTPIIFVSSINTHDNHVTHGYSLGAVDYIFSPIEPEILRAKVSVFIELAKKNEQVKYQAELLRREAERRAETLEDRLHSLLNRLDVGVFQATMDLKLLEVNPAFLRLVGLSSMEEIEHFDLLRLIPGGERNTVFSKASLGQKDVKFLRDDGTLVWISLNLRVNKGRASGGIIEGIVEDVTERKNAEEALRELNETLERRVLERTEALRISQENLRRTERLASLGTLAAGIAHEINNPLNSIFMAAERALKKIQDPEAVQRSLNIITGETKRCGKIIRGILKFAKNEPTPKEPHDLNEVVRASVEMMKSYTHSPLSIELDLTPELVQLTLNPTEIEQLIVNMLQNAIEAAQGEVFIKITTLREPSVALLKIEDNGPGIPREVIGNIFDPFFTTKPHQGGTGLGLSVVHGIVAEHGGSIRVESLPGDGAQFFIEFPL